MVARPVARAVDRLVRAWPPCRRCRTGPRRCGGSRGRGRRRCATAQARPAAARTWSSASSRRDGSLAAGHGQLGALAAAAADRAGRVGDQLAGVEAAVLGDRGHQGDAAALGRAAEHHGPDAGLVAHGDGEVAHLVAGRCRRPGPRRRRRRRRPPARRPGCRAAWRRSALISSCSALSSPRSFSAASEQLVGRWCRAASAARATSVLLLAEALDRADAGDRLDAAQVRADRPLGHDLHRADVAERGGRGCRRTARSSARPASSTRTMSPYLSPKKAMAPSSRASSLVVSKWRTGALARISRVGQVLDGPDLLGRDRLEVAEVEAQPVGRHQRALLLDVVAEHLAQRPVQDVGAGVVAADGVAALAVDAARRPSWPGLDRALDAPRRVAVQAGQAVGGVDAPRAVPVSVVMVPVSPTWPPDSA